MQQCGLTILLTLAALAWLEPYAMGAKAHIEFVHWRIQFDRDRAGAGQEEYAPHPWDAGNTVNTYALAALLAPAYRDPAAKLAAREKRRPLAWISLLAR